MFRVSPRLVLAASLAVLASAACGGQGGVKAPAFTGSFSECTVDACLTIPTGWDADAGDGFISISHPLDPAAVLGTLGRVDTEGLSEAAGGSYPAPTADVVELFFELLGEAQDAGLDEIRTLPDGSAQARGTLEGSIFWYRLIPLEGGIGIGVEVRAPNLSWAEHAAVVLDGVTIGAP